MDQCHSGARVNFWVTTSPLPCGGVVRRGCRRGIGYRRWPTPLFGLPTEPVRIRFTPLTCLSLWLPPRRFGLYSPFSGHGQVPGLPFVRTRLVK